MGKITDGEKLSRLTTKGTLRKKRGQPRIDIGIEFVIYAKLLQISKIIEKSLNIPPLLNSWELN